MRSRAPREHQHVAAGKAMQRVPGEPNGANAEVRFVFDEDIAARCSGAAADRLAASAVRRPK